MRIFACCNWGLKFLGPLLEYWRKEGHEVHYELGYNPAQHEWSDICFVDVCDHNAQVASQNRFPGSRLAIRAIDIETWVGQPGGVNWENVDVLIFGAKHIEELVRSYVNFPEKLAIKHIPFGIDPTKWTFKERNGRGQNIACIAHRWSAKGIPLLLQVMAGLKKERWKLHILGTRSTEAWLHKYIEHIIRELGLDVSFTETVPNVDEWLEDKDYLVVSSQKEAFSYAAAEAALKGIKPCIHNFWGARAIWPDSWIWSTIQECINMIKAEEYNSRFYRQFVSETYSMEKMMRSLNEVCGVVHLHRRVSLGGSSRTDLAEANKRDMDKL